MDWKTKWESIMNMDWRANWKYAAAALGAVILIVLLVVASCQGNGAQSDNSLQETEGTTAPTGSTASEPTTQETQLAETELPTMLPPETEPPATEPPETEPPKTEPAETEPPETEPPETEPEVSFQDVNETVYTTRGVNVRKGPGSDTEKLGSLNKGAELTRTGIGDNGWSRVEYEGGEAYVFSDYLTKTKPTEEKPKKEENTSTEDPKEDNGSSHTSTGNTTGTNSSQVLTEMGYIEPYFLLTTPNGTKVRVGETLTLDFEYKGDGGNLEFLVDDTSVAHSSGDGEIYAQAEGMVRVEVYIAVNDHYILWDWVDIIVVGESAPTDADPLAFTFLMPNGTLVPQGSSGQLKYDFDGSTDQLLFESEYPSIAVVDDNGVVTGVSMGITNINVFVWDGTGYAYRDFLTVSVCEPLEGSEEDLGQGPDTTVVSGDRFSLTVDEIRIGDIELTWKEYKTNLKNKDGTPATVYYNLYIADAKDGPFYLDCEELDQTSLYMAGFDLGYSYYFKVRAYVVQDGVATAAAESVVKGYTPEYDEDVVTSSADWNFDETQMKKARKVAKAIADDIMADETLTTDLERIAKAAKVVIDYAAAGDYTTSGEYYNTPYGVFIAGEQSCAGCTRALGLILEYMGFQWGHVNPNSWGHQWCVVYDVDGKTAFADGSWIGVAGYGSWLSDTAYRYVEGEGLEEYTGSRPF